MKGAWEEAPGAADALTGEAAPGADEAVRLSARVARYSTAKFRAVRMRDYLETIPGEPARKARVKLGDCGEYLHFRHYYTAGKVRLHAACFCKQHLICPLCAIRRGAKTLQAYLDRFAVIRQKLPELQPYLITFTVKNGSDLAERFNHLHKAFKRLQGRRREWLSGKPTWTEFTKVRGCVGTYEVSNIGNGWHPHLHMVALCASEPSQKALRAEWEAITGDSFMVDVRPFQEDQDPAEAFMEVMKYAVKFSKLSLADNWHAAQVLARRRLLFNFGDFRGVQVPESLIDKTEDLDGLPYVDLFYRYFGAAGYCLTGESPPQGEGQNDREHTASKALTISRRAERNARKREKTT